MTIEEIESKLRKAAKAYYTDGDSPLEDVEYDALVDELRARDPQNPYLLQVGAAPSGQVFEHKIPVGSQEKLQSKEEFDRWIKQTQEASAGQNVGGYVLQWKLDGLTIVLYYEDGKLVRALTRGDGFKGEDVTANVVLMQNVKKQIPGLTGQLRGEILLKKSVFAEKFAPIGYKNPRNTVAGLTRDQKKTGLQANFMVRYFDVFGPSLNTELDATEFFKGVGLESVETKFFKDSEELWAAYKAAELIRPSLDFEVDGVIVRANSIAAQAKLGMSSDLRPKGQKCIKFKALGAVTEVIGVIWSIGHTGAMIPTAQVKPVEIGGVTISNVLLNNPSYIKNLGVAIGSKVKIVRSGDVIPTCIEVVEPVFRCPECGFVGTMKEQEKKHS